MMSLESVTEHLLCEEKKLRARWRLVMAGNFLWPRKEAVHLPLL